MAIGFKKSLFGFNCADVINYIESAHKSFGAKEKSLNDKVDELLKELNTAKENQAKLEQEKQELDQKINEMNIKYEEVERLSENIGKLYLVAQTNAKAIMNNSEESAKLIEKEVEENLYSINEAHKSLQELRQHITKTSDDFIAEVESLMTSLSKTREKISANNTEIENASEEFNNTFKLIVS
jgi:chromosome segregation ATPase